MAPGERVVQWADNRITDFLELPLAQSDLEAALRVVRAFKKCEGELEWLVVSFEAWAKLEQLEEFLAHRVEGAPLKEDTVRYRGQP